MLGGCQGAEAPCVARGCLSAQSWRVGGRWRWSRAGTQSPEDKLKAKVAAAAAAKLKVKVTATNAAKAFVTAEATKNVDPASSVAEKVSVAGPLPPHKQE